MLLKFVGSLYTQVSDQTGRIIDASDLNILFLVLWFVYVDPHSWILKFDYLFIFSFFLLYEVESLWSKSYNNMFNVELWWFDFATLCRNFQFEI